MEFRILGVTVTMGSCLAMVTKNWVLAAKGQAEVGTKPGKDIRRYHKNL